MADLAVGISKTTVEALVNKFKSAVKEEADLWQIVQHDLVFIKDEFEMMESFLNTADGQCVKNNVMKTWVRQVGDLSYNLEDCAELVDHLDTKRSWWGFCLRLMPTWCKSGAAQPLDEAVAEIKLLKARVEEVSQRNMRYNLIDCSGSKSVVQMQQVTAANATSFDILDAANNSREDNNLQVISVCGTGGELGTVSIIREAYNDSRIKKNFKCRAWVKLMHPFNPQEFIRNMVVQF